MLKSLNKARTCCCALLLACTTQQCAAQTAVMPPCTVGMHLPIVSPINRSGTLLAIDAAKGSYQVKGEDGLVDWVPARSLRYSCVGAEAAPVAPSYFIGKWSLFIGPAAHHEVIDGEGYLIVGSGAQVPPLEIKADGSYVWVIDSKTTVRGNWRSMAESELRYGTKSPAILLLKAEDGANWEIWKTGVNAGNNRDAISIERIDMGLSYAGTRLQ